MVSPSTERAVTEKSTANGIEIVIISVERQLPRKRRIIMPVRAAAMMPSRITPDTAAVTKID